MTKDEFHKAIDICEKLDFFGGQRAGRELWFDKPVDVQDRDIQKFVEDVAFLKDYIKRQQAEIDRLTDLAFDLTEDNEAWDADNHDLRVELKRADEEIERKDRILESYALQYGTATDKEVFLRKAKADAIREFAERLHKNARTFREYWEAGVNCVTFAVEIEDIDNLVKELTEDKP